jgi:formiminotetrahydrofolate cyclodeaminase
VSGRACRRAKGENPRVLSVTVEELLDELAHGTPVAAAGAAAALVTATAAAVAAVAARASFDSWAEAGATAAQADALRGRAVTLAAEDAEAVEAFIAARNLNHDVPSEQRDFRLGRTLERAADVPLSIAETASDVAILAAHIAARCRGDVRGDAVAAAFLAHGAARAAAHLVEINLAAGASSVRVKRSRDFVRAAAAAADEAAAL